MMIEDQEGLQIKLESYYVGLSLFTLYFDYFFYLAQDL